MCQYSCEDLDGLANDWHLVNLGALAVGTPGMVFTEAAAVTPEGRISPQDLGFWSDAHAAAIDRAVQFVHGQGVPIGIQLAHAGRKAATLRPWDRAPGRPARDERHGWVPVAPSAVAFAEDYFTPAELDPDGIRSVVDAFGAAAARADRRGFDVIEIHAAHGYLLHEFMSPLSNFRSDLYGGSFENRIRMTVETVRAVRAVWPQEKPLFVRISATDWVEGGWSVDESVRLAQELRGEGVDLIDCSSGGASPDQAIVLGPGYQVPFADRIRHEAGVPTGAVGLITTAEQAESILASGQADLIIMARQLLRDPHFPLHAARTLGAPDAARWPDQYARAK